MMLQLHEALNVSLHNLFSPESISSLLWMFSAYVEFQMKSLSNLKIRIVTMIFSTVALQNVSLL